MRWQGGKKLPTPEEVQKKLNIHILTDLGRTMDYIAVTPPEHISSDKFKFSDYLRSLPLVKNIFILALNMFDPRSIHNALRDVSLPFNNVKADCSAILYIIRTYIFINGCGELRIGGLDALDVYRIPHYLRYLSARLASAHRMSSVHTNKMKKHKQQPNDEM